jgi:hypothetical protein
MIISYTKKLLIVFIIIFSSTIGFFSCTHEPSLAGISDTVCFDSVIFPMLRNSCAKPGCHDAGSQVGGFDASSYESIIKSVNPGDARGSRLYKIITDIGSDNMMPPKPDKPLSQQQRMLIEVWIAQGAPNKSCSSSSSSGSSSSSSSSGGPKSDSVCFKQTILPLIVNKCSMPNCHNGLSTGGEDALIALTDYPSIMAGGIVPGHPEESAIYQSVTGTGEDRMPLPPQTPLSSSEKESLRRWIADGALDSDCPGVNCDTTGTIGYTAQIKPILDNNCVSCHKATVLSGGVNLDGIDNAKYYATTIRIGTSVPILVGVIRQKSGFKSMPPGFKLDECTIRKVELWIGQGMPN